MAGMMDDARVQVGWVMDDMATNASDAMRFSLRLYKFLALLFVIQIVVASCFACLVALRWLKVHADALHSPIAPHGMWNLSAAQTISTGAHDFDGSNDSKMSRRKRSATPPPWRMASRQTHADWNSGSVKSFEPMGQETANIWMSCNIESVESVEWGKETKLDAMAFASDYQEEPLQ